MADKMRWRYGETNPIMAPPKSESLIEIGDFLWWDITAKLARPFCELDPLTSWPSGAQNASKYFLGVAMQRSPEGDTTPIRVATTGVFELDSEANQVYELGEYVAAVRATSPLKIENQKVLSTTSGLSGIGFVEKRESSNPATVLASIKSTWLRGGIRGSVYIPT